MLLPLVSPFFLLLSLFTSAAVAQLDFLTPESFMDSLIPRNVTGQPTLVNLTAPGVTPFATVILANGLAMSYGTLSSSVQWQASGVLLQGCTANVNIQTCYQLMLAATGQLQPGADSPRQRIEFLSTPYALEGETWRYRWRYNLTPGISSGSQFTHLMQLLSRDMGGFVIALDTLNGRVRIVESVPSRCPAAGCPSVPNSAFRGITTMHDMAVRFGTGGSITYTIRNAATNALILSYSFTDSFVPAAASIKTGVYRAVVATTTPAMARLGNFNFQRTA
ncbi:hypothetical protein JCM8097_000176 [Rhodosporidiobolus ruineniae]